MNRQVCHNVQTAVGTKNHLIVAHEGTNTTDRSQLSSVATLAQEAVGREDITVLADKGYYSRSDIKAVLDTGAVALVPKGDISGEDSKGLLTALCLNMTRKRMFIFCRPVASFRIGLRQLKIGWNSKCTSIISPAKNAANGQNA